MGGPRTESTMTATAAEVGAQFRWGDATTCRVMISVIMRVIRVMARGTRAIKVMMRMIRVMIVMRVMRPLTTRRLQ